MSKIIATILNLALFTFAVYCLVTSSMVASRGLAIVALVMAAIVLAMKPFQCQCSAPEGERCGRCGRRKW